MKKIVFFLLSITILVSSPFGHGGRTNSKGCHNDKKNGTYHYH